MRKGETFFHLKKLKTIYVKLISTLLWTILLRYHIFVITNTVEKNKIKIVTRCNKFSFFFFISKIEKCLVFFSRKIPSILLDVQRTCTKFERVSKNFIFSSSP